MNGESLAQAEQNALKALDEELRQHGHLNLIAFDLINLCLSRLPELPIKEIPLPQKISTSLLVQLSNDLRTSSLLSLMGYPIQAATIVSSMYEIAYCIAAIGSDQTMAEKWVNHEEPTKPFLSIKKLTIEGLRKLGHPKPEEQLKSEYRVYQQLCMAKHKNPLFHMQHGYIIQGNKVVSMNGPSTSKESIRTAWFVMEHASGLAFRAMISFIQNNIPSNESKELIQKVKELGDQKKQLEAKAIQRWGIEDPFPGKW
jgi:hypothetical protein